MYIEEVKDLKQKSEGYIYLCNIQWVIKSVYRRNKHAYQQIL